MSPSDSYAVVGQDNNEGTLEVWNTRRLPFRPIGELLSLRDDIRAAVSALDCDSDLVLHGVYVSPIEELCDTENVLFYNVGTGCFGVLGESK